MCLFCRATFRRFHSSQSVVGGPVFIKRHPYFPPAPPDVLSGLRQTAAGAVLTKLRESQFGWVFNDPVDPVHLNLPDYFEVCRCVWSNVFLLLALFLSVAVRFLYFPLGTFT